MFTICLRSDSWLTLFIIENHKLCYIFWMLCIICFFVIWLKILHLLHNSTISFDYAKYFHFDSTFILPINFFIIQNSICKFTLIGFFASPLSLKKILKIFAKHIRIGLCSFILYLMSSWNYYTHVWSVCVINIY